LFKIYLFFVRGEIVPFQGEGTSIVLGGKRHGRETA